MSRAAGAGLPLSFDVNHRRTLWEGGEAPTVLKGFAERADILFVGLDEAEGLWGTSDLSRSAPSSPGCRGSSSRTATPERPSSPPADHISSPPIPTDVVEAVGAGDAFAAGYLHRHLAEDPPGTCLRTGHERASLTLQTTSDFPEEKDL